MGWRAGSGTVNFAAYCASSLISHDAIVMIVALGPAEEDE